MPSKKPLISLRLSRLVHDRLQAAALADGRTATNYIEQLLKRTFGIVSTQAIATKVIAPVTPILASRPVVQPAAVYTPLPKLPIATREDAKHGMITDDHFDIPGDWINGEGYRRDECEYDPCHCYYPPDDQTENGSKH